ncbi:MAG: bifunctional phosphoglucose/phosphomannose isomerase [Candidatus Staskawiczbacteria bacterium]|jgi:glucose/mannose-6-phosphate isomerase
MQKNIIDKLNMREVIIKSPEQLIKGLEIAKNIKIEGTFKNVIICGIGGSALPANILSSVVTTKVPLYVHRDYNLPVTANEDSLIVCISYSGNTEETVSALEEALNKNITAVAIATGGKIEKICEQHNIALAKIPAGIQPRSATGYLFSTLSTILNNCGIIDDLSEDILNTAKELEKKNLDLEKEGKTLAKKMAKKIPIVYASNNFKIAARIWKIKFNENSKIPAFHNYFPELNHNEMVGFTDKKNVEAFYVLIIKDKQDHARTLKRMNLMSLILKKKGVKNSFIETVEGSMMLRLFEVLLLGDWTSYYIAINNNVDPTPVEMVEEFKLMLNK